MALVALSEPILVAPLIGFMPPNAFLLTETAMNAAGESTAFIGQVHWSDGGTHTVSSAAGAIYWQVNATPTFANGATTVQIGLQDVSGGLEDGSYDVSNTLTGGTDIIGVGINGTTMATGSKTIAEGDVVAVVITMTARGGADTVSPGRVDTGASGFPYCTVDSGAGPVKTTTSIPFCAIEADDGTFGLLGPAFTCPFASTTVAFNSGDNPDEYAMIFQVPFRCAITRLVAWMAELDTGETGTLTLYSDPTGTPVSERSVAVVPENFGVAGASPTAYLQYTITEFTLEPDTDYAIAYAATSAGNRTISLISEFPDTGVRVFTPFGTTLRRGQRQNATGAFSTSTSEWPRMGFWISKLDDGSGSGGGGGLRLAGHGGLAA